MKRMMFLSGAFAALMALASCEKTVVETDFTQEEIRMVPVTLSASIPETRVSLDGTSPKWTAGDQIAVYTTAGALCPAFTTQDGGSSQAEFSGTKPDGSTLGFAIYPYSAAVSASGSTYTLTVPAEQDGTLGSAVMAAAVPAGEGTMVFSNLCNVVKMTVPASLNVRKIEFLRDDAVSGTFTVNGSTLAVTTPSSPADAAKRVTATRSSAFSGEVYLSVLPSTSKKIRMVLTNASGQSALVEKDLSTAYTGGHLKNLGAVPSTLSFTDVAKIGGSTGTQQYVTTTQPEKQQITNGDFEEWNDNLPTHFNSFQTADWKSGLINYKKYGYDSNDRQVNSSSPGRDGSSGRYCCHIWSRQVSAPLGIKRKAQGNLTTGCVYGGDTDPAGSGNYNYTKRSDASKCMAFTGRPDSLVFWAKFVPVTSSDEARVAAYLHDNSDFKTCADGSEPVGTKIALAKEEFSSTTNTWKRFAVAFDFDGNTSSPSYILFNAATNKTAGEGSIVDHLYLDDIEIVYNLFNLRTDANGWATLCLNYAALVPSGATAYYITKVAAGYARLVSIPAGQVIPKGTGVLVKGSANTTYAFNGRASDISGKTVASVSGNLLQGTLTSTAKPSGTCRVLSSESTASMAAFGAFTGSTLAANTAYLTQ